MDLKKIVDFMREEVDPNFDFEDNRDKKVPFTELDKKINKANIVLISSGGFYLKGDEPFDTDDPLGDPSYRMIPKDTSFDLIKIAHTHYDHKYVKKDLNCAYPLQLLKELENNKEIGVLAEENYSFMGYCLKIRDLKNNAVKLSKELKNKDIDAALISPT